MRRLALREEYGLWAFKSQGAEGNIVPPQKKLTKGCRNKLSGEYSCSEIMKEEMGKEYNISVWKLERKRALGTTCSIEKVISK